MGRRFTVVFTGAPYSGKTTTIEAVAKKLGAPIVAEAATSLARSMKRVDEAEFSRAVLRSKIENEANAPKDGLVLFDRAIPDSIPYYKLSGLPLNDFQDLALNSLYNLILIFDPLPFQRDWLRNEFDEKNRLFLDRELEAVYRELGYSPIRIAVLPLHSRVELAVSLIENAVKGATRLQP